MNWASCAARSTLDSTAYRPAVCRTSQNLVTLGIHTPAANHPLQLMRYKYGLLPDLYTPTNEAVHRIQIDAFWWLLRLKTDGLYPTPRTLNSA